MITEIEYTKEMTIEGLVSEINWRIGQMVENQQIFNNSIREINDKFREIGSDISDMKKEIEFIKNGMNTILLEVNKKVDKKDLENMITKDELSESMEDLKRYIDSKLDHLI